MFVLHDGVLACRLSCDIPSGIADWLSWGNAHCHVRSSCCSTCICWVERLCGFPLTVFYSASVHATSLKFSSLSVYVRTYVAVYVCMYVWVS